LNKTLEVNNLGPIRIKDDYHRVTFSLCVESGESIHSNR